MHRRWSRSRGEAYSAFRLTVAALLLLPAASACRKSAGAAADGASTDVSATGLPADVVGLRAARAPDVDAGGEPSPADSAAGAASDAAPGVAAAEAGVIRGVRLSFPALHRATAPPWLPGGPDGEQSERTWAPAPDVLGNMLDALPGRLEADGDGRGAEIAARLHSQARSDPADARWERYAAQIVALDFAGRRLIYANFVCDPGRHENELALELVLVKDGGSCYFQVWFDPATGDFPKVTINGEG